jgi:nucleoside-diphosphate-sugar epimerase
MAGELYGDIGDPTSIQIALAESAPQVVVHLAGITYPAHPSPAEIYDANVTGGVHLLSELAALKTPPELTIVASSATVYGTASGREIVEDDVLAPSSHYGVSKSALEAIAALYAGQMRIQITRPFNYTGPGQPTQFFVPKVVDHFARDAGVMEVGNLDLWRDISSLNDILEAYVRLIEGGAATSPLNLCSGQSVRLGDVIDMVAAISGRGLDIQVAKRFIRPGEPRNVVGSRAKLDATIGAARNDGFALGAYVRRSPFKRLSGQADRRNPIGFLVQTLSYHGC